MRSIKKMNDTYFDGLDELYHRAKFGEDCRTRRLWVRKYGVCHCFSFCLSRSKILFIFVALCYVYRMRFYMLAFFYCVS